MTKVIDFTQKVQEREDEKKRESFLYHMKRNILPYLSYDEREQLIATIDNEDEKGFDNLIKLALERNIKQAFGMGEK